MKTTLVILGIILLIVFGIYLYRKKQNSDFDNNCRSNGGVVEISGNRCNFLK